LKCSHVAIRFLASHQLDHVGYGHLVVEQSSCTQGQLGANKPKLFFMFVKNTIGPA
jgi:hypothetical protein